MSNMYDAIIGDVDVMYGERVFNMLEIVRRSKTRLGLSDFIAAAACASFDKIEDRMVQIPLELPASRELQMAGRELKGLCRGLIDIVDGLENSTVQFVYQTVQDFVSRPESLSKWLPQGQPSVPENGHTFLSRFMIAMLASSRFTYLSSRGQEPHIFWRDLETNAYLTEVSTGSSQQAFLDGIDDQVMKSASIKQLHKCYGTYYPIDSVLTFAVVANLRLYVVEKLQADPRLVRGRAKSLLHCVAEATLTGASITSNYDHGVQFFERPHDLTQMASLLITYGVGHNNIFQGSTPFQLLFHQCWPGIGGEESSSISSSLLKLVGVFLEYGQNPDSEITTGRGYSCKPLHVAPTALIKLLLKYDADINTLDEHGRTPLDIAFGVSRFHHTTAESDPRPSSKKAELLLRNGGCMTHGDEPRIHTGLPRLRDMMRKAPRLSR